MTLGEVFLNFLKGEWGKSVYECGNTPPEELINKIINRPGSVGNAFQWSKLQDYSGGVIISVQISHYARRLSTDTAKEFEGVLYEALDYLTPLPPLEEWL